MNLEFPRDLIISRGLDKFPGGAAPNRKFPGGAVSRGCPDRRRHTDVEPLPGKGMAERQSQSGNSHVALAAVGGTRLLALARARGVHLLVDLVACGAPPG